jgi:hypothetical protein
VQSWLSADQPPSTYPSTYRLISFLYFETNSRTSSLLSHYNLVAELTEHLLTREEGEENKTLVLVRVLSLILGKKLKDATQLVIRSAASIATMKLYGLENATSSESLSKMLEAAVAEACESGGGDRDQMIAALCDVCLRSAFHGESGSGAGLDAGVAAGGVLSVIPSDVNTLYLCGPMERLHRAKMSEMCLNKLASDLEE